MPWAQEAGKRDEKVGSKPKDWPQGKQADEISSFEYWINTHTLEIPQTKNRRVPLPWHKGAVNGIKSDLDNSFITYSATKKNTGLRLILENSDYWASCKAPLIPCFVILELTYKLSHLPVDTVLGGTGGTLQVERGLGLLVPELFPRAATRATVSTCLSGQHHVKASGAHSPVMQAPEAAFPSALAPQSMTSYRFPDCGTSARCNQQATHPLQWDQISALWAGKGLIQVCPFLGSSPSADK